MDEYGWLLGIPLVGGAGIWALWILFGWAARRSAGALGILATVAKIVAAVACAWTFVLAVNLWRVPPAPAAAEQSIDLGVVNLSAAFRADGLSSLIVLAAAGIALLVVFYSMRAMAGHAREPVFFAYLLWGLAAVMAAALADTFIVLIVAWEIATVLLYLLIGMGGPESRTGAMKTFAVLGFADACLLLGVVLLLGAGRLTPALAIGGTHVVADAPLTVVAFLLMVAAALAKAGAMPLHTWIPSASDAAPIPAFAFLPAALDKLLGIYLLARLTFETFAIGPALATVLMVIGAATILCAVFMAMIQHNLRRLLAFHAVSQVGYMVLGMGIAAAALAPSRMSGIPVPPAAMAVAAIAFAGGLFHMLNNSLYKCALFLSAGAAERVAGTTDLDRLGGLARVLPVTFVCSIVAALAISGVPPLNGFVSKWLVYQAALGLNTPLGTACLVAAVFGSALTLASFIKVLHSVFLGTRGSAVPADDRPRESFAMAVPMVALALACVGLGVFGGWAVERLILPAAASVGIGTSAVGMAGSAIELRLDPARPFLGLWDPTVATGLILIGVAVGLVFYVLSRGMKVRVVSTFVGGEDATSDAQWHVSGTHFYETIRRLPVLRGVFGDASAGVFDVYRLSGRYGRTVVERLRAWHTGVLAAYASWVLVGLMILVLVLAL
ncbi:MAG: proton-conducting transporter membrane subunit [Phycisphaerae bacterium]